MLIPAFSMLIKRGTACAVEGDMKVAMAMSILKTNSGTGQLAELWKSFMERLEADILHSSIRTLGQLHILQLPKTAMENSSLLQQREAMRKEKYFPLAILI